MHFSHLENSEMEPKVQKYQGHDVLRGDVVKDDAVSYAVLTEKEIVSIRNEGPRKFWMGFPEILDA